MLYISIHFHSVCLFTLLLCFVFLNFLSCYTFLSISFREHIFSCIQFMMKRANQAQSHVILQKKKKNMNIFIQLAAFYMYLIVSVTN
jgi:phosphatidylglycerophosphate synthase